MNPLDPKEAQKLEEIKSRLLSIHKELAGEIDVHRKELKGGEIPENFRDAAPVKEDLELLESESLLEENEIHLVEDAMQRIASGTFGKCLACGKIIPVARLEALPYAKFCVPCEEKKEKKK